jgi:hypothetical protein
VTFQVGAFQPSFQQVEEYQLRGRKRRRGITRPRRYDAPEVLELDPAIQKLADEAAAKLSAVGHELAIAQQELSIAQTTTRIAKGREELKATLEAKIAELEKKMKRLKQEKEFIYLLALTV